MQHIGHDDEPLNTPIKSIFTEHRFKKVLENTDWVFAIGFALYQAWNILCVSMPDPVTYINPFLDLRWLSLATAGVFALALIFWPQLFKPCLSKKQIIFAFGALSSIGSMLGPLSAFVPQIGAFVLVISAIAVGLGFAGLFFIWFNTFVEKRKKTTLAFGIILAVLFTYPLANILLSRQTSTWLAVSIVSLLPIISVSILNRHSGKITVLPQEKQQSIYFLTEQKQKHLIVRFCLCLFLVATAIETVHCSFFERGELGFYAGVINLCALVLKLICGLYILIVIEARDEREVSRIYRFIFLLLLAIVLFLPLPLKNFWVANVLTSLGSFCFQLITTMTLYEICMFCDKSVLSVMASARAAWAGAGIIGITTDQCVSIYGTKITPFLVCGLGLATAVAFIFVFSEKMYTEILSEKSQSVSISRFKTQCNQVVKRFSMSERESEVFALIAKGRSARRIAEELNISIATVNSHVYHIYQKTGVHSNQELIDLIEIERQEL